MANCNEANNTLDPYQILLDAVDKNVTTLEKQALGILPYVQDFRSQGEDFNPLDVSPENTVNMALNQFTSDAICASKTDLEPVNQFVEDCLNDILRGIKKYLNDILDNIADGVDLVEDVVALPESLLMKLMQQIWALVNNIKDLVGSIDGKLRCITSAEDADQYTDQVDALQTRVNNTIDSLYLGSDGSFDVDTLTNNFDLGLQNNLKLYKSRSDALQLEIKDNVDSVVKSGLVNPKSKY